MTFREGSVGAAKQDGAAREPCHDRRQHGRERLDVAIEAFEHEIGQDDAGDVRVVSGSGPPSSRAAGPQSLASSASTSRSSTGIPWPSSVGAAVASGIGGLRSYGREMDGLDLQALRAQRPASEPAPAGSVGGDQGIGGLRAPSFRRRTVPGAERPG